MCAQRRWRRCAVARPAYATSVANQNCTRDLRGKLYASCAKLHTMDVPYGGFSGATRPHATLPQGHPPTGKWGSGEWIGNRMDANPWAVRLAPIPAHPRAARFRRAHCIVPLRTSLRTVRSCAHRSIVLYGTAAVLHRPNRPPVGARCIVPAARETGAVFRVRHLRLAAVSGSLTVPFAFYTEMSDRARIAGGRIPGYSGRRDASR